jgi:hypothetical protein
VRWSPRIVLACVACAVCACLSATPAADGAQSAKLQVALRPERLGQGTTIVFSFRISSSDRRVPSPLIGVSLLYPPNFGLVTSGLGLASCSAHTLEEEGPEGCSPNALMGYGSALVEIPIGPVIVQETGSITTWMAPVEGGHLVLLFYADGESPVSAQLIFTGTLLDAPAPFGGRLDTEIPVIPTLPEAPDAAVVQMRATLGPLNVTYYQRLHGKRLAYHPNGIRLPRACPRGGFPFAARFLFLDGTAASARTRVPCP